MLAAPTYIPITSVGRFPFLHILSSIVKSFMEIAQGSAWGGIYPLSRKSCFPLTSCRPLRWDSGVSNLASKAK